MDRKYSALSPWDQSLYSYEFEPFEIRHTKTDYNLLHLLPDPIIYELLDDLVILQFEFPNCLIHGDMNKVDCFKYDKKVKKIITNCPFSVDYFNERLNYDKFVFGFSSFNPKYIPTHGEKDYEVFYTGHVFNSAIRDAIPVIQRFKSCFVSNDFGDHRGVGYEEKLSLNAKSKISVVHGLLKWPDHFKEATKNFQGHGAFDHVMSRGIVPQMKTRTMEAAASKSLILCFKDPWNVIESYFEENKDFIYWETLEDLNEKIQYVLSHYDEFEPMIENAYNTLMNNFTTNHFFDKYLKDL